LPSNGRTPLLPDTSFIVVGFHGDAAAGHRASALIFAHVEFGYHRLLLAHLCVLHKTDFSREHVEWNVHQFGHMDPLRQLADDCVLEGHALFLSSFPKGAHITVGQAFKWEPLERAAFGNVEQDVI
jgi:hypothetical protein